MPPFTTFSFFAVGQCCEIKFDPLEQYFAKNHLGVC